MIFEGGKIIEIASAKIKTTEKGKIKINKEMAIFCCQVVHCLGTRGNKVSGVEGVLEKLVAFLHLSKEKPFTRRPCFSPRY